MPSKKPQIGLHLDDDLYQTIVALAIAEDRPLANMATVLLKGGLQEFLRKRGSEVSTAPSSAEPPATVVDLPWIARTRLAGPGPR